MKGWATVIAALGASVVTATALLTANWLQARREDRTRWSSQRREIYARFLAAAGE